MLANLGRLPSLGVLSFFQALAQQPSLRRYLMTERPLNRLCIAIDTIHPARDSARVWWWQPGDRGCLNRSTGPSVFPVVDAQVVTHAGGREISVRFKLQLHAPAGEAAFENISLIWAGDTVRAVPSGTRVAILRHPDLQIPPSP